MRRHLTHELMETTDPSLRDFMARHRRLFVLTGAGISTASGIPDYRDRRGEWKRPPPMTYQQFMGSHPARQRYWARSMIGWQTMAQVRPNLAHRLLVAAERQGRIELLVTQNVDGLHEQAGSLRTVDLHGRIDRVRCMECEARTSRAALQHRLEETNPDWLGLDASDAPDGDADLDEVDFSTFAIPACEACGGVLKPDVVFFGEAVPRERVTQATAAVEACDAMLVLGSSLMVFSGYRFAALAHRIGKPIAAVNQGHTRADDLLALKIDADAATALQTAFTEPVSA